MNREISPVRRAFSSIVFLALFVLSSSVFAQAQPAPRLEPLPPPPPLPAGSIDEPRVRIPVPDSDRVREVSKGLSGDMYEVTPPNGVPYYLMNIGGTGGVWWRRDSVDDGVRAPAWKLFSFD
jgi:hypothetical protein